MTAGYRLQIKRSAEKEVRALPREVTARVIRAIRGLAVDPRGIGSKKLAAAGGYRARVGSYRILYTIDDNEHVVTVVAIGHRREIYR
jgi:mRNA interferase RelE/StbE